MTRRGVLDPTRTDRSVRSVAILDTNSGENVDALLLVYPNDDASVVARTRAMKGLLNLARSGGVAGNAEAAPAPAPAGGKVAKAKVNEVDLDEAVV